MDNQQVRQVWAEARFLLAVAFPRWVIQRFNSRTDGKGFAVRAIPFVIVFLSLASVTNLASRAYIHHANFSAYLTGAGIAILVPLAVLAAMLIEGRWQYLFWATATLFAIISGTIQFNIYLIDVTWLSIAEAVAFGYGIPLSEVLLAVMEAQLIEQSERKKKAEAAEQRRQAREAEALKRQAEREAEKHDFECRRREAELAAYEAKLKQDAEIEREKAMAAIRIKEQKVMQKPDSLNQKMNHHDSEKRIVLDFYALNPLASQREAADATGVNQPKISRMLKKLESSGVIHRNGNGVEILEE